MIMGETRFLYRDAELNALLTLLELRLPHFTPDEDSPAEDGLRMMLSTGLCEQKDDKLVIDRITAFLMKTMGEAQRYCIAVGKDTYLGLFLGKYASVVFSERRQYRIAEPFRTAREAVSAFQKLLGKKKQSLTFFVGTEDGPEREVSEADWRELLLNGIKE